MFIISVQLYSMCPGCPPIFPRWSKRQPPSRRSGAMARRAGGRAGALQDAVAHTQTLAPPPDFGLRWPSTAFPIAINLTNSTFLSSADFGQVHFHNPFQPLRIGERLVSFGERLVNPVQRFTDSRRDGFVRQPVINPAFRLARQNQTRLVEDGEVFGHGG